MKTLGDVQREFADTLIDFLAWIKAQKGPDGERLYQVTWGDFLAHDGHMANSCHYIRLAADLNLFIGGVYQDTTEAHRPLGEKWKTMHPLARWGGDFPRPDGNHYSFAYQDRA